MEQQRTMKTITIQSIITADDFWSNVNKTDACWHWIGRKGNDGRGIVHWKGKQYTAHRLAWLLTRGATTRGSGGYVRQSCSSVDCVRPDHLFVGHPSSTITMNDLIAKTRKIFRSRDTECWEWTAGKIKDGYGHVRYQRDMWLTHRLAWKLTKGSIPEGKRILHKCDNPPCINPDHLFIGTDKDNRDDMISKGRQRFPNGTEIGIAKLTDEKVREIRSLHAVGISYSEIGRRYGVSHVAVRLAIIGRTWKHVT